MKRHINLLLASALSLSALSCTQAEEDPVPPAGTEVIKILAPAAPAAYKVDQDVMIIAESDYSKFASGINVKYSKDDGKTWTLMKSKVRKEGIDKDTLIWNFNTELPGVIAPGTKVTFQVCDYDRKYLQYSPVVTFTN